jgi:aspartate/methionine/tyrosine aminotransferase
MPVSPILAAQATYPFVRLNQAVAERHANGLEVIDFGMGDPREPTDPLILQALRDGVRERMGYPAATGLPELREAIAAWVGRRFAVELDPDRHVIPTLGSKEAIFSFAHVVLDVPGGRDTVVVTEPGYPVPGRGAEFARASELWFDEPPASALQLDDWTNVVAFNTLSKRSSMTGFRSGFVAGDPRLIDALRQFRPNVGTAPQEFVQRASVVAWGDEGHVERTRETYRRKRELILGVLRGKGLRDAGGAATMYLWIAVPDGEGSEEHAARLLDAGVGVAPGSYLGPSGEGYVRYALVPPEDECARAAEILEDVL